MSELVSKFDLTVQIANARRALTEVETVEEAIKIADFAEAVRYAAKQAKQGMEVENAAAEIRLRAERRAGEMLEAHPDFGRGKKSATVDDFGINHGQSKRFQEVGRVPERVFEDYIESKKQRGEEITTNRLLRIARESQSREPRQSPITTLPSSIDVRHGDLRYALDDLVGQVDAIVTDPPYPAEFLAEFDALGQISAKLLRPGGILIAMVGQTHLPEYIARIGAHLPYRWCGAYLTDGPATRVFGRKVGTKWKPLLIFGGDRFITQDVFSSSGDDKTHHHWGQSESGMADVISRLTEPGELVVDPFLGGGTTAIVCRDLGRRFVGCDIDANAVAKSMARLAA